MPCLGLSVWDDMPIHKWTDGFCLDYPGDSSYMLFPGHAFVQNGFTVEMWLKDFGTQVSTDDNRNYLFRSPYVSIYVFNAGSFVFETVDTTGSSPLLQADFPSGLDAAAWLHLVARYHPATHIKDVFINGALTATFTIGAFDENFSGGDFILGAKDNLGNNPWRGKTDEFRIYNRWMDNSEITANYHSGTAIAPVNNTGLLYWFPFEKNTKNKGSLGNAYQGALYNFGDNPFQAI